MRFTLIESRRRHLRIGSSTMASLAVHAVLGAGITAASLTASRTPTPPVSAVLEPFVVPSHSSEPHAATARAAASTSTMTSPAPSLPAVPTLPGSPHDIQPLALTGKLDSIPITDRLGFSSCPPSTCGAVESGTPVTSFTSSEVDQPATVISQPRPRYPSVLQAAGLTGQVTIEFVIDTTGRVEPSSVRIVASSHPGFESSATETILGSRFHPGKVRGMPVRQLFRQTVAFRLEP